MTYTVIYSGKAIETFDTISKQIEYRWGLRHVFIFEERILKVVANIQKSPFIFQAIDHNVDIRKAFIHKNCSMFYKVTGTRIEVLFFWDNRQDPIFL